jgi:hypothetical protein
VSLDFSVSQLPGWHSTIFPPYFVAGAIFSGLAMVLTLLIPLRRLLHLEDIITARHIDVMCKATLAMGCIVAYAYAVEFFSAWFSDQPLEKFAYLQNRVADPFIVAPLTGVKPAPYWQAYWITILCNVGIISEGVSVDDVMCCLLLRPTESHALYWQQAMRCMRYLPGKVAKIIDCVGNYSRNPKPDAPVEWSLTQPSKRKPKVDEEGNFPIRVCKNCFLTFKTAPVCPYCGKPYPLHPREIEARQEIELKRITAEETERMEAERKRLRQEVGRAKTYPELLKIAKERGYDQRWVMVQMRLRRGR